MDYNLSKKIRFNNKSEQSSLYSWCINDIDDAGKDDGDMIPWNWSLFFSASKLQVHRTIKFDDRSWDNNNEVNLKNEFKTLITGDLFSGIFDDDLNLKEKVSYSMFGTDRIINSFSLSIYEVDSVIEEKSSLYACPSYESENSNFVPVTEDDYIGIELFLTSSKFNELVRLIESNQTNAVSVSIGRVNGFYSNWSPTINTRFVKVLTDYHEVENIEDCKDLILRTGNIGQFSMSFHSISQLNTQPIKNYSTFNYQVDEGVTNSYNDNQEKNKYQPPLDLNSSNNVLDKLLDKHTKSIKRFLWLIAILLIFILAK